MTSFGTGLLADVISYGEVALDKVEPSPSDWCPYRKQGRNTDPRGGEPTSGQRRKPVSLSRATCTVRRQHSTAEGRSAQRKQTCSLVAGPRLRCPQTFRFWRRGPRKKSIRERNSCGHCRIATIKKTRKEQELARMWRNWNLVHCWWSRCGKQCGGASENQH